MSIFAKNLTASGIYVPDLSGLYIPASGTADLLEYFDLGRIMLSLDLDSEIEAGSIIINDGTRDLDKAKSLEHTNLDLLDTQATYSGIGYKYLKIKDSEDGIEFTPIGFLDLFDTPATYSGYEGHILSVNAGQTGFEYIAPPPTTFLDLTDTPTTYSGSAGLYPVVNDNEDGLNFVDIRKTTLSGVISSPYVFQLHEGKSKPYLECGATNWQFMSSFVFYGSNVTPINTIKIIASTDGNSDIYTGCVRIYDYTNKNDIISITYYKDIDPDIFTYHGLSNLPENEAIFEIHLKKGTKNTRLYYVALY